MPPGVAADPTAARHMVLDQPVLCGQPTLMTELRAGAAAEAAAQSDLFQTARAAINIPLAAATAAAQLAAVAATAAMQANLACSRASQGAAATGQEAPPAAKITSVTMSWAVETGCQAQTRQLSAAFLKEALFWVSCTSPTIAAGLCHLGTKLPIPS